MSRSGALYGMLSVIAMVLLGTLLGIGSLRRLTGVLLALEVVSLVCIILTVVQISKRLN